MAIHLLDIKFGKWFFSSCEASTGAVIFGESAWSVLIRQSRGRAAALSLPEGCFRTPGFMRVVQAKKTAEDAFALVPAAHRGAQLANYRLIRMWSFSHPVCERPTVAR